MKLFVSAMLALIMAVAVGCKRQNDEVKTKQKRSVIAVKITSENKSLVYLYRDPESGSFKRVRSISEIPKKLRKMVLVSDPLRTNFPPPGKVIVADVSGVADSGGYPYQVMDESKYSRLVSPRVDVRKRSRRVTMFSTSTCGYCAKARQYLNAKGIRFKEYVLDTNPDARTVLAQRVKALNYKGGTNSVPIFEINGRMFRGFDRKQIDTLLGIP